MEILSHSKRAFLRAVSAGVVVPAIANAQSEPFPSRPLTVIVPFAAGGATDASARRFAEACGGHLGRPVVVENHPSAGGFVAVNKLLASPADGHTMLLFGPTAHALNSLMYKTPKYNTQDLSPISRLSRQPFAVSANTGVPAGSVQEFVEWARSRPEGVSVGVAGVGTTSHIVAVMVGKHLGINLRVVPYKGTSQGTLDLMAGRIDIMMDGVSTGVSTHNAGKTKLLAGMGQPGDRSILPSSVQNFADVGYPELVTYSEIGFYVRSGTSGSVIEKLHQTVVKANAEPGMLKLAEHGERALASASPEEFGQRIPSEIARLAPIVRSLNLSLDA
jgi:tripartite-type tricarboxylate transporter receptor subunit TctC